MVVGINSKVVNPLFHENIDLEELLHSEQSRIHGFPSRVGWSSDLEAVVYEVVFNRRESVLKSAYDGTSAYGK